MITAERQESRVVHLRNFEKSADMINYVPVFMTVEKSAKF